MFIVGLTGGIASGKTTVANFFSQLGVPVIDADIIAKALTQPDGAAYAAIVNHFGENILLPNQTIDRAQLRQLIFSDTEARLWLESLLHPLIYTDILGKIQQITSPYLILAIPLLFEVGRYSFINRTLVVDTPETEQIKRVMSRDQVDKEQATAILTTQFSRVKRNQLADDLIFNDQGLAHLTHEVAKLHKQYLKLAYSQI